MDVDRTILPIVFGGTIIEGAIDRGAIRAGGASLAVHELELEHKNGPALGLMRLGRELARDMPLVLSLTSKAERGYAVADASWGQPSKVIPLELSAIDTLRDLFMAVLQGCLHALSRNAALIGGVEDGDAVHKTRIALRHIRAALALFRPVLRRGRLARFERDLKWMSDRLGAARDADVFRQLAEERAAPLAAVLEPRRRLSHAHLEAALASARWRLLLIDVLAFSIEGVRRSRRGRRAAPFVRRRVGKLRRRLARDARGLRISRERPCTTCASAPRCCATTSISWRSFRSSACAANASTASARIFRRSRMRWARSTMPRRCRRALRTASFRDAFRRRASPSTDGRR